MYRWSLGKDGVHEVVVPYLIFADTLYSTTEQDSTTHLTKHWKEEQATSTVFLPSAQDKLLLSRLFLHG